MIMQPTKAPKRAPRNIAVRTGFVEVLSIGSASVIDIIMVADAAHTKRPASNFSQLSYTATTSRIDYCHGHVGCVILAHRSNTRGTNLAYLVHHCIPHMSPSRHRIRTLRPKPGGGRVQSLEYVACFRIPYRCRRSSYKRQEGPFSRFLARSYMTRKV